ncbi:PEP-CTERM putative exosortase interaction domain-containing protein [Leptolyngbya sp. PCC 7375]|nr:PEP-CTERM putative exosortase interaction domain-containing protein [Leptolyngbya sp. PCC 7375]
MMNRVCLMAATTAILTFFKAQVAFAQTVSYDFTVDVTSGPLAGERYIGLTSVDVTSLLDESYETVRPTSIIFDFGGITFTDDNDVLDIDANSPKVNFQDGQFMGITYIVSRLGNNPAEIPLINDVAVDGFAIDNSEFGYVVGANLYRGDTVNHALPPNSTSPNRQSVPEPSVWLGFATVGCGCWLTRRLG